MAFTQSSITDLMRPGVNALIKQFEKKTIKSIAVGGLNHKKWLKPARKMYLEIIREYYEI